MSAVTVGLYRGRHSHRWGARFLAWWQRCDYSHCAVVWNAIDDQMHVSDATLLRGVNSRWQPFEPALWELWDIECDRGALIEWVRRNEGQRYDWLGLLGFVWRRIKGASAAWWCSEMIADAVLGLDDPWRWDVAHIACYLRKHGVARAGRAR